MQSDAVYDLYRSSVVLIPNIVRKVIDLLVIRSFFKPDLWDILVESETVAQGFLNGVFSGKHYNRCICAHKLVFEAMERLRFEAFLDTQSTEQKREIIGLAKEIHGNLKQEGN